MRTAIFGGMALGRGAAPVVSSQTIDYGALTLASSGGAQAVTSVGGLVDFVSVTSQVGATRTWSVSGGRLIANGTPAVDDGIVLVCVVSGGASINVTLHSVANAYSFASNADITAILAIAAATTAGKSFLARTATYTSITVNKTWASDTTFGKHSGAAPIFQHFDINGATHAIFNAIEAYLDSAAVTSMFDVYGTADAITISGCTIHAKYFDPSVNWGAPTTKMVGIDVASTVGTVVVENNTLYNLYRGVKSLIATSIIIDNNVIYNVASDGIVCAGSGTGAFSTTIITDNQISNVYGTDPDDHGDMIQFIGSSGNTGDWTVTVSRNMLVQTSILVADAVAQGIFSGNFDATHYLTGTIEGNFNCLQTPTSLNSINVQQAKALTVRGNTVVRSNYTLGGSGLHLINIGDLTTSGTHVLQDNVAEYLFAGGSPTTTNNVTVTTAAGATDYVDCFDGSGGLFVPATLAQAVIMFDRKAAGPLDTNIGALPSYTPPSSETTVWSATLTANDTSWGGYCIKNIHPTTGIAEPYLVTVIDFGAVSNDRIITGLGTIPAAGATFAAFQAATNGYNSSSELTNGFNGQIHCVNRIQIRGSGSGREIRARFEAPSSSTFAADNCSIGIWNGTDTAATPFRGSTTATPVELLFSGVSGVTLLLGTSLDSDWAAFPG